MKLPALPRVGGLVTIVKGFTLTHRPELLLGTSIASTIGAVVTAAVGGYKSGQQVLQAEMDIPDETLVAMRTGNELSAKEKIQLTWLNYLPSAGFTAGAIGSTTALHIVHVSEKKALAQAALAAIEEVRAEGKAYAENLEQAIENNATAKTKQKIADDAMDPDKDGIVHVQGSDGAVEELYLVRDGKTGRDIWSNETRIDEAVNLTNKWLAKHGDCDLNTFYSHAGFGGIPEGDDWGWSGDFVELKWDLVSRDDGRPARRFTFLKAPKAGAAS